MRSVIRLYTNAFGGLSPSAWMLAVVILINRSGTMVIPFLSVYLISALDFTLIQAGWIMTAFGVGAIGGSFLGGWLTDKIGPFRVQLISLFGGGVMFLALSQITEFYPLATFIFFVSLVSEMLRPANQLAVASYARPENVTRAFSLNRMAINLGFSLGPAIGGLLAAASYELLFVADAVTCISAGLVFYFYFRNKEENKPKEKEVMVLPKEKSVWKDYRFLGFIGLVMVFAMLFFQLFTTWPIYQRQAYNLPEEEIGLLLGLNGLIVFLFEMIIVYQIGDRLAPRWLIAIGCLLVSFAMLTLFSFDAIWALYLACVFISFGEIFAMPYMVTHTVKKSGVSNKGAYMGLYSMGFASAFALAPLIGTNIIDKLGFELWWLTAGIAAILVAFAFYIMLKTEPKEVN